jgi:hypothetical protein
MLPISKLETCKLLSYRPISYRFIAEGESCSLQLRDPLWVTAQRKSLATLICGLGGLIHDPLWITAQRKSPASAFGEMLLSFGKSTSIGTPLCEAYPLYTSSIVFEKISHSPFILPPSPF